MREQLKLADEAAALNGEDWLLLSDDNKADDTLGEWTF